MTTFDPRALLAISCSGGLLACVGPTPALGTGGGDTGGATAQGGANETGGGGAGAAGTGGAGVGGMGSGGSSTGGSAPTDCGNGELDGGETCDDGATADGDGCSATCSVELGYCCNAAGCTMMSSSVTAGDLPKTVSSNYNGSIASMVCTQFSVAAPGNCNLGSVADVDVTVTLQTAAVGNLVIKIAHDGVPLALLSRPGLDEVADDGSMPGGGYDAHTLQSTPITFDDEATVSAELMGAGVGPNEPVCVNMPANCKFKPAPGAGPGTTLADFDGLPVEGTWTLCVGDADGLDTNTVFVAAALSITPQ